MKLFIAHFISFNNLSNNIHWKTSPYLLIHEYFKDYVVTFILVTECVFNLSQDNHLMIKIINFSIPNFEHH